jgi:thiol-disulfide isomerase/thioredoxin/uncharacterized membrane protein YphA (DoxX/SURF4 family)
LSEKNLISFVLSMSVILLLARLILAVVFGIAGIAKLADPAGSRKSIADFGVRKSLAIPLAWLLPLAELVCAVALLPIASAWWGAIGVLILLVSFIAGISVSLIRGRKPECHCFGQIRSAPIGGPTLFRNGVLAGISAWIVWHGREDPGTSLVNWNGLTGTESVLAALAIAVAFLAVFELWALIHVLRQNGRLMLRLEAVEAKVGGSVEAPPLGLPVGSEAPAFRLEDLAGSPVTLQTLLEHGRPLLLLFSEPGCGACDAALPEVAQWQREFSDQLLIVPISRGSLKENRAKSAKFDLRNVLLQAGSEVSQAYRVEGTPSAVLVKEGRIESSLAVGADAIRGLVTRATLPAPVKAGDLVPSLRLPDLSGELIDLAKLRSRRTLMLFWSPSCGFCQQMLEDLKKWEEEQHEDAPELVVIAAGAFDENRKQGFRSRVLLDPYYAASQVFNSGGTPSAVMIDKGRVASSVAVGAQAVLALAGAVSAG